MQPNDESNSWDEFQWEQALRESDEYAVRYIQLMKRFCDLPGGGELIARHMGPDYQDKLPDCDFNCEECPSRWDCEFAVVNDWSLGGYEGAVDEDDEDGQDDEDDAEGDEDSELAEGPILPGDPLFYESHPVFAALRQTAMGWCNIYAAILPAEMRIAGLKVLYHIGRALANLAYSIGDGLYDQPPASIAFAKRSAAHVNKALGLMAQMIQDTPRLEPLLDTIRVHLLKIREGQIEHLSQCRARPEPEA